MTRLKWLLFLSTGCWLGGCLAPDSLTTLVSPSPFDSQPETPGITKVSFTAASTQAAARVDTLGRKIIAANRSMGIRPLFRTIGAPQPEIFHRSTTEVDITEGLVNLCPTDGELAAILCMELGKMVSEREAQAGTSLRAPGREPPIEVRVGADNAGSVGAADLTRQAELATFEKNHPHPSIPLPPPEPNMLAQNYLEKSGFPRSEMEKVKLLLVSASANSSFEKLGTSSPRLNSGNP